MDDSVIDYHFDRCRDEGSLIRSRSTPVGDFAPPLTPSQKDLEDLRWTFGSRELTSWESFSSLTSDRRSEVYEDDIVNELFPSGMCEDTKNRPVSNITTLYNNSSHQHRTPPPPPLRGRTSIMYAYWVCAAREAPIFSPEFSFRSISFTQITKKIRSGASPFYFLFFGGFCRSGDHHFQNFFNFSPNAKRSAAPRVSSRLQSASQTRPGSSGD